MGLEDDIVYLKILIFTFFATYFIKRVPCPYRDAVSALLGIATICLVCGGQIFYSLPMVLVNLAIIRIFRFGPAINFVFCFGYLTFFRCAHLLCGGDLLPKYLPHANAVQLIMTLRCVGLAFEFSDQRMSTKEQHTAVRDDSSGRGVKGKHQDDLSDNWLDMFYYCYNLVGLFTGPYYSYRTHQDMVRSKHLLRVSFSSEVVTRLMTVPLLISSFLILQSICPLEDVHTNEFYENNSFLACLLYSVPVFAYTRMRCYIAWMMSEASCMVAGIGAYPKISKPKIGSGPTDLDAYQSIMIQYDQLDENEYKSPLKIEYDFETIRNIDVYGCEFNYKFRESMRCWNRSVQYWLATYIYRRCPWKSMRTSFTMLVSAYWHGVHAGYYLSFMTVPLCLYAEDLAFSTMEKKRENGQSRENHKFRICWWFFRMRAFEYMVMGFLLLSWSSTVRYWASTYYFLHSALIVLIICFWIKKLFSGTTKEKKQ